MSPGAGSAQTYQMVPGWFSFFVVVLIYLLFYFTYAQSVRLAKLEEKKKITCIHAACSLLLLKVRAGPWALCNHSIILFLFYLVDYLLNKQVMRVLSVPFKYLDFIDLMMWVFGIAIKIKQIFTLYLIEIHLHDNKVRYRKKTTHLNHKDCRKSARVPHK